MSKKQAIAFFEEISKNTQLAQEVEKVVGEKNSDEAKAKEIISLAQRYNFNFTPDEAVSAQGSLKKPLSPEEMIEVSGGKLNLKSSLMALTLLAGLGAAGAALSNMEASAMKRSTPGYGKSRKIAPSNTTQGQTLPDFNELISKLPVIPPLAPQGQPTATTGTQQQTAPQTQPATTGTTNSAQSGTSPSNIQGTRPETHQPQLDRAVGREDMTYERLVRWANEREIKIALLQEDCDRLAGKYKEDRSWIGMVACAVANGFFPDFHKKLKKTSVRAPREGAEEPCAYCGETGCVKLEKPYLHGSSRIFPVRCTNVGCPLNWVVYNRVRLVPARERSITPTDRDITRWKRLPKLVAEIQDLVDRTEYDCSPVRLHVSAESARQANDERKRKKEAKPQEKARWQAEARRQRKEEARQPPEEKLRLRMEAWQLCEEKLRLWIEAWQRGDKRCPDCGENKIVPCGKVGGHTISKARYLCQNKSCSTNVFLGPDVPRQEMHTWNMNTVNEHRIRQTLPPLHMLQESHAGNQINENNNLNNFNNNNNLNNLNNNYNYDANDGFEVPFNRKPKEVKERREDYENQGLSPSQSSQQPMQQTFAPNLFNANKEQSFNIQRIPVFQMPTNQNDTQQQNEQIDPLNMDQMHITDPVQPIDQLLEEDQLINDDQNDLVMQQNTQVYQDQQPMNDRPGLNFDPTQVLQQLAAQQNVTQPPQNPNENGFTWQFDAENNEDTKPGLWNTWGQ